MNNERTIILNMLSEGKISVEEAESLLQALGEESKEPGKQARTEKDEIRIDLGGMKAGLKSGIKEFAKTMEGTLKSAMEGLKTLDLENVFSTAFGRAKESVEKELIVSADGVTGIDVKTSSGDVVVSGNGTGEVLVRATVTTRGSDDENAKKRAEEIEIIHTTVEGVLQIRDSGSGKQNTGPYSVD